jgi:hypothetical protein
MGRTLEDCRALERLRDYVIRKDPAGRQHAMLYYASRLSETGGSWEPIRSSRPLAERDDALTPATPVRA